MNLLPAHADLNELVGPLLHEVTNYLNVVQLQTAVIERFGRLEPTDLAEIKRQSRELLRLVRQLQDRRHRLPQTLEPTPTAATITQALMALAPSVVAEARARLSLDLDASLPPILAVPGEFARFCRFWLLAVVPARLETHWRLTGRVVDGKCRLELKTDVAPSPDQAWPLAAPPLVHDLEWEAAAAIARRRGGCLEGRPGDETLAAVFPAATGMMQRT